MKIMNIDTLYTQTQKRCSVKQVSESMVSELISKLESLSEEEASAVFCLILHHYSKTKAKVTPEILQENNDFYGFKEHKEGVCFSKLPIALKRVLYTYLFH